MLVDVPHFRVERVAGMSCDDTRARFTDGLLVVPLSGTLGQLEGLGEGNAVGRQHLWHWRLCGLSGGEFKSVHRE